MFQICQANIEIPVAQLDADPARVLSTAITSKAKFQARLVDVPPNPTYSACSDTMDVYDAGEEMEEDEMAYTLADLLGDGEEASDSDFEDFRPPTKKPKLSETHPPRFSHLHSPACHLYVTEATSKLMYGLFTNLERRSVPTLQQQLGQNAVYFDNWQPIKGDSMHHLFQFQLSAAGNRKFGGRMRCHQRCWWPLDSN